MNKKNLKLLKENILNYIIPLEKDKINYYVFTNEELNLFYKENYYINNMFVKGNNKYYNVPLGMHYLSLTLPSNMKVFICSLPNNLNKETIIGSIIFNDNYSLNDRNVFLIDTIEINYFYRGNGLLNLMYNEFVNRVNIDNDIMLTCLSQMGYAYEIDKKLALVLRKNKIDKNILFYDDIYI